MQTTFSYKGETWMVREVETTAPGGEFSEHSDMARHLEFQAPDGRLYHEVDALVGVRLGDLSEEDLAERAKKLGDSVRRENRLNT